MGFVLRAAPSGIRRSHTASIAVRNLFVCRSVTFAVVRFWTSTALRRGLDSEHVTGPVRMNEKLSFTKNHSAATKRNNTQTRLKWQSGSLKPQIVAGESQSNIGPCRQPAIGRGNVPRLARTCGPLTGRSRFARPNGGRRSAPNLPAAAPGTKALRPQVLKVNPVP